MEFREFISHGNKVNELNKFMEEIEQENKNKDASEQKVVEVISHSAVIHPETFNIATVTLVKISDNMFYTF